MTVKSLHRQTFVAPALLFFVMAWCLLSATIPCLGAPAANQDFPLYPVISKNVQFWEKIYAVYSLKQAVIHDSEDLSKIYQVVSLVDLDAPDARRQNTAIQQQACEKYSSILKKLAEQPPSSAEEQRVAGLFQGKNARQAMALAANNVRGQSGQKERFQAGVYNSGAYLAEIKKLLRSYGLPEELAHLPHVESSFNTKAYSRIGAAGLWQFTRETGKQYLKIDSILDERLDPIASTHAAAKYLANSYRSLNNWPLAITSYNYGLGGMMRAVNEEGSYEKIFTNYNKGYFKFASRNFYSEFLAACNVAKYLENGINRGIAPEANYRYLILPGYVHIHEISRHLGLPVGMIEDLNPALRPPVISGERLIPKGYALRLPAGGKTNQLIASLSSSLFRNEQKSSRYHVVQKGDTANSVARLHRVSFKDLVQVNNLDKSGAIRLGQNLLIPGKADEPVENGTKTNTNSTRITIQKKVITKDTLPQKEVAFTNRPGPS
jgi:membrane-bound lytic murein transglycosylase D